MVPIYLGQFPICGSREEGSFFLGDCLGIDFSKSCDGKRPD